MLTPLPSTLFLRSLPPSLPLRRIAPVGFTTALPAVELVVNEAGQLKPRYCTSLAPTCPDCYGTPVHFC